MYKANISVICGGGMVQIKQQDTKKLVKSPPAPTPTPRRIEQCLCFLNPIGHSRSAITVKATVVGYISPLVALHVQLPTPLP